MTESGFPKLGDLRCQRRFAILPIKTRTGIWVWLGYYHRIQEYKSVIKYGERILSSGLFTEKVECYYYPSQDWVTIYKTL